MAVRKTNETYKITVESPLLRPGLKISTKVSKRYLVPTLEDLMEQIREFNQKQVESEKTKSDKT